MTARLIDWWPPQAMPCGFQIVDFVSLEAGTGCLPFQLFIVLSVLSFTQQPSEVWISRICSLAGTMTEIAAKQVTCTAKLLTLLIIHKGCLEGAGNRPARSYSFGQACLMQHPLRGIDKHFWYKLFWKMFPMWRSNVTRDQFRS